jgi:hypothetical protein
LRTAIFVFLNSELLGGLWQSHPISSSSQKSAIWYSLLHLCGVWKTFYSGGIIQSRKGRVEVKHGRRRRQYFFFSFSCNVSMMIS